MDVKFLSCVVPGGGGCEEICLSAIPHREGERKTVSYTSEVGSSRKFSIFGFGSIPLIPFFRDTILIQSINNAQVTGVFIG
mmetsp:Transcript_47370/g.100674  ORF Transcript_47370/g.100674 Transcript_47370/m.100674 type:complete len:81 (+) Transcript_47370:763-1005(+)